MKVSEFCAQFITAVNAEIDKQGVVVKYCNPFYVDVVIKCYVTFEFYKSFLSQVQQLPLQIESGGLEKSWKICTGPFYFKFDRNTACFSVEIQYKLPTCHQIEIFNSHPKRIVEQVITQYCTEQLKDVV